MALIPRTGFADTNAYNSALTRARGGLAGPNSQLAHHQVELIKRARPLGAPPAVTPPTPAMPATPAAPITPQMGTPSPTENTANTNALFPSSRAFEPQNYQGSPLYSWRLGQGQQALDRVLARDGLLNSGAEVEANQKLSSQISGEEADTARAQAEKEADRLQTIQENESQRQERGSNEQFDRIYQLLSLGAQQNPLSYAYGASGSLAGNQIDYGNSQAKATSDLYGRPTVGASRGGGGSSMPPFIPPAQPGNFAGIQGAQGFANAAQNTSYSNILSGLLGSMFK